MWHHLETPQEKGYHKHKSGPSFAGVVSAHIYA